MGTNRFGWRCVIRKGTETYLNARQSSQQVKRAALKARTITAECSTEYPVCSRLCVSDFGLRYHIRWYTDKQRARLDFIDYNSWPYMYVCNIYIKATSPIFTSITRQLLCRRFFTSITIIYILYMQVYSHTHPSKNINTHSALPKQRVQSLKKYT